MFCSAHLWFNSASPTEQCRSHIALSTECCGNLNLNFHCYRIWTTLTLSGEVAPGPSSSTGAHTPAHVPAVDIRHLQYPQERLIFFLSFFFFPLSHAVSWARHPFHKPFNFPWASSSPFSVENGVAKEAP